LVEWLNERTVSSCQKISLYSFQWFTNELEHFLWYYNKFGIKMKTSVLQSRGISQTIANKHNNFIKSMGWRRRNNEIPFSRSSRDKKRLPGRLNYKADWAPVKSERRSKRKASCKESVQVEVELWKVKGIRTSELAKEEAIRSEQILINWSERRPIATRWSNLEEIQLSEGLKLLSNWNTIWRKP